MIKKSILQSLMHINLCIDAQKKLHF